MRLNLLKSASCFLKRYLPDLEMVLPRDLSRELSLIFLTELICLALLFFSR